MERTAAAAAATAAASASTAPLMDSNLVPMPEEFVLPLACVSGVSLGSWADVGRHIETHAWRRFLFPSHFSSSTASTNLLAFSVNVLSG